MSLIVRTLSDRVFEIVREEIVSGKLGSDGAIRQDALAAKLGVSKIPLREALARLEQEGLLTNHANRGYFVQPMSNEQAEEIFELRLFIEPPAAARGAERASDEERATAKGAFERLDRAARRNLPEVAMRNRDFHTALVRPSGRVLTTQLIERLTIMAERYVTAHLQPTGRDARANLEHAQLIEAWLARDGVRTEQLLRGHIEGTLKDLEQQFAGQPERAQSGDRSTAVTHAASARHQTD
jgi:DNA-binding GntR family transcriptional regulator